DVEREREEGDVAGGGRVSLFARRSLREALEERARQTLQPAAAGRVQGGEQGVLHEEGRAEERREAAQQAARVEGGELVLPERPQEKEREHPARQPRVGQYRVEGLRRREEERGQRERVRDVRERRQLG